jgi:hypothetical protein
MFLKIFFEFQGGFSKKAKLENCVENSEKLLKHLSPAAVAE